MRYKISGFTTAFAVVLLVALVRWRPPWRPPFVYRQSRDNRQSRGKYNGSWAFTVNCSGIQLLICMYHSACSPAAGYFRELLDYSPGNVTSEKEAERNSGVLGILSRLFCKHLRTKVSLADHDITLNRSTKIFIGSILKATQQRETNAEFVDLLM